MGYIGREELEKLADQLANTSYGDYLRQLVAE